MRRLSTRGKSGNQSRGRTVVDGRFGEIGRTSILGAMMTDVAAADMATNPPASGDNATLAEYTGSAGRLAWLIFRTSFLTVITLGVYRFWMKTKVRQYYWSAISIDGEPLEYTGRALELFVGFLVAILFLAVYLFAINFALIWFSVVQLEQIEPAIALSSLAVLPFIPYAAYRAERYLWARTRWRGIRFGLESAAWGYAGRWFLWTIGSFLTLGLLSPLADFSLRKYITDRMSFGDQKFRLVGSAGGLYRGFFWVWGLLALALLLVALPFAGLLLSAAGLGDLGGALPEISPLFAGWAVIPYIAFFFAAMWYSGYRLQYLLNRMELENGARLQSSLSPWRITWSTFGGYLLTMLAVIAVGVAIVAAAVGLAGLGVIDPEVLEQAFSDNLEDQAQLPAEVEIALALFTITLYLAIGLVAVVAANVFITQRILRRITITTAVQNLKLAASARQQEHVEERGAEGLADALDVGAF